MKKIALLSIGLFALVACNNQKTTSSENSNEQVKTDSIKEPLLGGEKDKHGCIASTGETWSELKQECLQIFNVGERLNPIGVEAPDAVISAFVLFNDDKSKAELFLRDEETNPILDKSEDGNYQNEMYKYNVAESAIYKNGKKTYSK